MVGFQKREAYKKFLHSRKRNLECRVINDGKQRTEHRVAEREECEIVMSCVFTYTVRTNHTSCTFVTSS